MSYEKQVSLLIDLLNFVGEKQEFALKGGTAINLFYFDMPRLSIDIDLVYLPIKERRDTLRGISEALKELAINIKKTIPTISIVYLPPSPSDTVRQLLCTLGRIQVKIEVNIVIRGTLYETQIKALCPSAQKMFGKYAEIQAVSKEDLYGSKMCAALDRQHPRDLFDMMLYFREHSITQELKNAFIFYLLSHNRPIAEVLNPTRLDLSTLYKTDFMGMTSLAITLDDLYKTREALIQSIYRALSPQDKEFILSFKAGVPKWFLCAQPKLEQMPSVQWKLLNIKNMDSKKRLQAYEKLKQLFDL